METCANYVPRHAAICTDSSEGVEKGLRLRKIHVKGDQPTINDFCEVSLIWCEYDNAQLGKITNSSLSKNKIKNLLCHISMSEIVAGENFFWTKP